MIRLHGYWRPSAAYRVRIALNLKGAPYEQVTHDLRRGEQGAEDYALLNPLQLVPAVEADGRVLTESPAILEWLEERIPDPPLLPADPYARAMVAIVACDIHPLHNLRVLSALRQEFAADETSVANWITRWFMAGLPALESLTAEHGDGFVFGSTPTLADCCIVPQLYAAERFGVDLSGFPALRAAGEAALALPAVQAAHPSVQPDAHRP